MRVLILFLLLSAVAVEGMGTSMGMCMGMG